MKISFTARITLAIAAIAAAALLLLSTFHPIANMQTNETPAGLNFRLSETATEGTASPTRPTPIAPVNAAQLSPAELDQLIARLPPLSSSVGDVSNFQLRDRSLPPPRAGEIIRAAFAPPTDEIKPPDAKITAPLEITRFAPEGQVELAPFVSVTFSQPMIAVSSQTQIAENVPAKLSPQPKGAWRWLGTQTLVFQPDNHEGGGRLPMATDYTLTVAAGTKSIYGNALDRTETRTFSTAPLTVKNSFPAGEAQPRDAIMFVEFDQQIDARSVLEKIRLQQSATKTLVSLRLATAAEINAHPQINSLSRNAQPGRWLAFRAVSGGGAIADALPGDSQIKVIFPAGTPSAEGPRASVKEQSFTFKTYGPLRVTETYCGYEKRCSPFDDIHVSFSNQLVLENFQSSQVTITPEIPDAKISAAYNSINVAGVKRSGVSYTVKFDRRALRDTFGQTLAGDDQVEFAVKPAEPNLLMTGEGFVTLDPAGPRAVTVYSINYRRLRVRLYQVAPEDWSQFRAYHSGRFRNQPPPVAPPGKLVFDQIQNVAARADELTESAIDLSPALVNEFGQVLVLVDPVGDSVAAQNKVKREGRPDQVTSWVQSTDIGLDAFADRGQLIAWTNSLRDGRPLEAVQISVTPDNLSGVTAANGLAQMSFGQKSNAAPRKGALVVARRGDDVALLPQSYNSYYYGNDDDSWRRSDLDEATSWYAFDDRRMYRPGEEVHVKGWLRKINLTPLGGTEMFDAGGAAPADKTISYTLKDAQGRDITKGSARLNALSGFDLKFTLPATMTLGQALIYFDAPGASNAHTHGFQVQEFRRPEFEISTHVSAAPHFVGAHATATMTAAYYSGGGLAATAVDWDVTATPISYTPPNRGDFTFGKFYPWWRSEVRYAGNASVTRTFQGRTDAEGKHTLRMDFDSVSPARPSSVNVQARVQDVNRQTLAASETLLVHPSEIYVGLKSARTFVQRGETFEIETIAVDLDGRALTNRDIKLRLVRLDNYFERGQWQQREVDVEERTARSASQPTSVRLPTKAGGIYRLTAQVRDARERLNESELTLWVAGGETPAQREVEQQKIELIPDRRTYAGGDVAEILVQSPFAPAEGVVTLRRSGLLRTERFTMKETSYTLRVPVEAAMTPNVRVQIDLVGAAKRDGGDVVQPAQPNLPQRPAYATGEINLQIPPVDRRLNVVAAPRDQVLEPGAQTVIEVEVKDAKGSPVKGTDTAVVVVDESVLALTDYKLIDPLGVFYAERGADVNDYHSRQYVSLADPEEVLRAARDGRPGGAAGGGGGGAFASGTMRSKNMMRRPSPASPAMMAESVSVVAESAQPEIQLRSNFNALAVFAASVPTDARGRAQISVKLPDNLTRYRVMAVSAADGKFFGVGESAITARRALMVRPSAPRFLNYGDRAELPVVIQNQTDAPMDARVAVRASNARLSDEATSSAGRRVTVPANDRVEVRFPVAADLPGTARFQIVAVAADKFDAAAISLPVYTPATTEAFATYGVIDASGSAIAQLVKAPDDVVRDFGGLEVTAASTQLQELTDAVIYLTTYPYECSEQISSRIISIVALEDVLAAFKAKDLPATDALRASVAENIERLRSLQNEDGGFDFWRRGQTSNPYVSVHVAHALARARGKDFSVPEEMLGRSRAYLREIEKKIPAHYSAESKRAIRAYAVYVRALFKDRDANAARRLLAEAGGADKLSLEALGWLLPVLSSDQASAAQVVAVRRHINNRVTETSGAAHFTDNYSDGAYTLLHSDRRADAVLLDALIGDQPQSDLIPKIVRGLLGGRVRGRWANTQENVFVLLALDRYFKTYESATPDFVARVWLGQSYAGERTFAGRSVDRQQLDLPMRALVERTAAAPANLTISKEGAGRLYFRIGTQYAPRDLKLAAADYGFKVERSYEAVDDPGDVRRDADGLWRVKAGARVRVRVKMLNTARRYHVALVDPIPAGLEILNAELATTEKLPAGGGGGVIPYAASRDMNYYWPWYGPWYEHQNLRDERAEVFSSLLWEGEHEYTYFARATTPGTFVAPPSKAEEMYAPETFGRGASDRVRVE